MKKLLSTLGIIAGFIAVLFAGVIGKEAAKKALAPSSSEIEAALITGLHEGAKQINAKGKYMIDPETRMDGAVVGPGARVAYFHTLTNRPGSSFKAEDFHTVIKPLIVKGICDVEQMRLTLRQGVTYEYVYMGRDGNEITRFSVLKGDCPWRRE